LTGDLHTPRLKSRFLNEDSHVAVHRNFLLFHTFLLSLSILCNRKHPIEIALVAMVQRTLCEYFRSKRPREVPRKVTFLHLPLKVRRDIYLLAGLPSNSIIYLNYICSSSEDCIQEYDPHYPEHWPIEDEIAPSSESLSHFLINGYLPWPGIRLDRYCACLDVHHSANSYDGCRCEPLPYQLLYVSKVIADEVTSIFYSENHFSAFRDSLGGLSGLNSLPQGALQKMTSLSIASTPSTEIATVGNLGRRAGVSTAMLFVLPLKKNDSFTTQNAMMKCLLLRNGNSYVSS